MTYPKLNVVFIVDSLKKGGGAESSVLNLAVNISERDMFNVSLLTLSSTSVSSRVNLSNVSSKLHLHECGNSLLAILYVFNHFVCKRTFIISALTRSSLVGTFLRFFGFKHFISFRSDVACDYSFKPFLWFLSCLAVVFSHKAFFLSNRAKSSFLLKSQADFPYLPINSAKCFFIHNAMKIHPFPALQESLNYNISRIQSFVEHNTLISICICSRLISSKGILRFISDFSDFLSSRNVILNIYGDGPQYYELSQLIHSLGLSSKVFLHGHVDCVSHYLDKNNIFFFPSMHEGFGKAPLEALFRGLPVLCNYPVDMLAEVPEQNVPGCWLPFDFSNCSSPLYDLVHHFHLLSMSNPFLCASKIKSIRACFSVEKSASEHILHLSSL